ncbi:MAG: hypothetical protein II984_08815 [Clostridia bacterium]|nr:hypothetical protein [Clostridia bacterium]
MNNEIFIITFVLCFYVFFCFLAIKLAFWMEKIDKKADKETLGFEVDDYKTNRKIRVVSVIIFFIFATVGLLFLFWK